MVIILSCSSGEYLMDSKRSLKVQIHELMIRTHSSVCKYIIYYMTAQLRMLSPQCADIDEIGGKQMWGS